MWRTSSDGSLYPGYPSDIALFWEMVDGVTAVFEKENGRIIFVKGKTISTIRQ